MVSGRRLSEEELEGIQQLYLDNLLRDTEHYRIQQKDAADIFEDIIQPFFDAIEEGTANLWAPDPFFTYNGEPVSQELADKIVEELDAELNKEAVRRDYIDANSDLMRAPEAPRLAFAQRILGEFEKGKFPLEEDGDGPGTPRLRVSSLCALDVLGDTLTMQVEGGVHYDSV